MFNLIVFIYLIYVVNCIEVLSFKCNNCQKVDEIRCLNLSYWLNDINFKELYLFDAENNFNMPYVFKQWEIKKKEQLYNKNTYIEKTINLTIKSIDNNCTCELYLKDEPFKFKNNTSNENNITKKIELNYNKGNNRLLSTIVIIVVLGVIFLV